MGGDQKHYEESKSGVYDYKEMVKGLDDGPSNSSSRSRQRNFRYQRLESLLHPEQHPEGLHHRVVFHEGTSFQGSESDSRKKFFYTLLWCTCSASYSVLVKLLLDVYPRPWTVTSAVLLIQATFSIVKWTLMQRKRAPRIRKLRRRHYQKLLPASLLHGVGTVFSHHAALWGPMSTSVLIKLVSLNNPVASLLVLPCLTSNWQTFYGMLSLLFFAFRSRIRISTPRFNGGQNVFHVICLLSLLTISLPGTILMEGADLLASPMVYVHLLLLGVAYCVSNEMAFTAHAMLEGSNLYRLFASWIASVLIVDAVPWQIIAISVSVFVTTKLLQPKPNVEPAARYPSSVRSDRAHSYDSATSMGSMSTTLTSSLRC